MIHFIGNGLQGARNKGALVTQVCYIPRCWGEQQREKGKSQDRINEGIPWKGLSQKREERPGEMCGTVPVGVACRCFRGEERRAKWDLKEDRPLDLAVR